MGMRSLSCAILLAALAGCADLHWEKSGATPTALQDDLEACRGEARLNAPREAVTGGLASPAIVGVDARGQVMVVNPPAQRSENALIEHDLANACMRRKGYRLAPAAPQ